MNKLAREHKDHETPVKGCRPCELFEQWCADANSAWYDITYYEDEDGEAGEMSAVDSGYRLKSDAIRVANECHHGLHAWISWHKPNAADSGDVVWSREPLAPKDERTAIRWLLKAIELKDQKRTKRVVEAVTKFMAEAPTEAAA